MRRHEGSVLVITMVLSLLLAAVAVTFHGTVLTFHRAASEAYDRELSLWAAKSGGAYYLSAFEQDDHYFDSHPAPHASTTFGASSFELESAVPGMKPGQWTIVVVGRYDSAEYSLSLAMGNKRVTFPVGVAAAGTGQAGDNVFHVSNNGLVASYDSADGPFDSSSPGEAADVSVKGNLSVSSSSSVYGDVRAEGTYTGSEVSVSGDIVENTDSVDIVDIDSIVARIRDNSRTSNDNASLASIFGSSWSPVAGTNGYGDLLVDDGQTYVVPPGRYRFRRLTVTNGTTVIFDTSTGPSELVYVGSGAGTGSKNDLLVDKSSAIKVQPGITSNVLMTVLCTYTDLKVHNGSIFGQAIGDENSAGYSQILGVRGDFGHDDIEAENGSKLYARIHTTGHDLEIGDSRVFGSAVVRRVKLENGAILAVDEGRDGRTLMDVTDSDVLASWRTAP